jgi:receptor protein-tyrosine kinase
MMHDGRGEAASHIRALRARLLAIDEGRPPRIITITSGARQEGKTTLSFNFGAALSEISRGRVLLIDGDVLKPSLHRMANLRPGTGLGDVLGPDPVLDDRIYETAVPQLDLLAARRPSDQDHYEEILSQNCGHLLNLVRRYYDYVVVDTPPVPAGSQAATFGKHSDGVLFVARLERTPREVVKRWIGELTESGSRVLGCVLMWRRHHIPGVIYRFFGTPPRYYYGDYRLRRGEWEDEEEQADGVQPNGAPAPGQ